MRSEVGSRRPSEQCSLTIAVAAACRRAPAWLSPCGRRAVDVTGATKGVKLTLAHRRQEAVNVKAGRSAARSSAPQVGQRLRVATATVPSPSRYRVSNRSAPPTEHLQPGNPTWGTVKRPPVTGRSSRSTCTSRRGDWKPHRRVRVCRLAAELSTSRQRHADRQLLGFVVVDVNMRGTGLLRRGV